MKTTNYFHRTSMLGFDNKSSFNEIKHLNIHGDSLFEKRISQNVNFSYSNLNNSLH
jgi:hypothetical protein